MEIRIPNISKEYQYCNFLLLVLILLSIFYLTPQCQNIFTFFQIDGFHCFYKEITGNTCKTCGMTRAMRALLAGNYQLATAYHPQSPLIFLMLIVELGLRLPPLLRNHALLPWIDIMQLIVMAFICLSLLI